MSSQPNSNRDSDSSASYNPMSQTIRFDWSIFDDEALVEESEAELQIEEQQPASTDVVLGNLQPPPTAGMVLGGLAGIKYRLAGKQPEQVKCAALAEALKYGQAGLELLEQIMHESSGELQWVAYDLLFGAVDITRQRGLLPLFPFRSANGVDYQLLLELLIAEQWIEANQLTNYKINEASGFPGRSYLHINDIPAIPALDLRTLDQLWVKATGGHFGFSIQRQILIEEIGIAKFQQSLREFHNQGEWVNVYEIAPNFAQRLGWDQLLGNIFQGVDLRNTQPIGYLPQMCLELRGGSFYIGALLCSLEQELDKI